MAKSPSTQKSYLLTEEEAVKLNHLLSSIDINKPQSLRYPQKDQEYQRPDVFVVKVPNEGIPALTIEEGTGTAEDIGHPGFAEADIYRIVFNSDETVATLEILEFQKMIFNLSQFDLIPNQWILVCKDRFGKWVISPDNNGTQVAVVTNVCPTYETFDIVVSIQEINGGFW